ncbi:DNA-directed RNA polymerase subunit omega [uncultured Murdochiella sp.]|uniref:DNA-directed RNA polymerase subunit omega n=1 Tax=uncultured Murdochiella sp. TaxID=1586095 RepID=UPI002803A290|nr:DNA-directed RNA polymerase subunit omega [uncultured Murdochiella sp.]
MINPSFRELGEISPSRYDVCVMVMKRARLLTDGSQPLVESKGEKPVTVALDEIMQRKVTKVDHVAQMEE